MHAMRDRRFGLHTGVPAAEIPKIDVRYLDRAMLGAKGVVKALCTKSATNGTVM